MNRTFTLGAFSVIALLTLGAVLATIAGGKKKIVKIKTPVTLKKASLKNIVEGMKEKSEESKKVVEYIEGELLTRLKEATGNDPRVQQMIDELTSIIEGNRANGLRSIHTSLFISLNSETDFKSETEQLIREGTIKNCMDVLDEYLFQNQWGQSGQNFLYIVDQQLIERLSPNAAALHIPMAGGIVLKGKPSSMVDIMRVLHEIYHVVQERKFRGNLTAEQLQNYILNISAGGNIVITEFESEAFAVGYEVVNAISGGEIRWMVENCFTYGYLRGIEKAEYLESVKLKVDPSNPRFRKAFRLLMGHDYKGGMPPLALLYTHEYFTGKRGQNHKDNANLQDQISVLYGDRISITAMEQTLSPDKFANLISTRE